MALYNQSKLSVNDRIIFKNIDLYTMSLRLLFIEYFPYVVYVYDNHSYKCVRCVRKKWI